MRSSPGEEGSAEEEGLRERTPAPLPEGLGGLEQVLLDRIAALEAQVVDRHGLLAKIHQQQNAALKAQVAKARPARGRKTRGGGQTLTPWCGPGLGLPSKAPELRTTREPAQRRQPVDGGRPDAQRLQVLPPQFLAPKLETRIEELEEALGLALEEPATGVMGSTVADVERLAPLLEDKNWRVVKGCIDALEQISGGDGVRYKCGRPDTKERMSGSESCRGKGRRQLKMVVG
eukprot:g18367.t1